MNQANHTPLRDQHANRAPRQRQQKRFRQKLPRQSAPACSYRRPDRQLPLSGRGLGQQQVCDVGTSNQQQKTHRPHQNQQSGPYIAGHCLLQSRHRHIRHVHVLAELLLDLASDHDQLGVCLIRLNAIPQPTNDLPVVRSPTGEPLPEFSRQPYLGLFWKSESRRKDADHRSRLV